MTGIYDRLPLSKLKGVPNVVEKIIFCMTVYREKDLCLLHSQQMLYVHNYIHPQ